MNKKKTITTASSVTAALVLGVGGSIYFKGNNEATENLLDQYEVSIPSIDIPEINIPEINILDVDIAIAEIDIDDSYSVSSADASTNAEVNTDIADTSISNPDVDEENPNDLSDEISTNIDFYKDALAIFKDKRMISEDVLAKCSNENIKKWMEIYSKYRNYSPVEYIKASKFRMISEVRPYKNGTEKDILAKNMAFFKRCGYDSVLVAFDKEDSKEDIISTIKFIKNNYNLNIYLTYSGNETLKESLFIDPIKYENVLIESSPHIKGFINSWRRTSAHLWVQDIEWMNFTNHTLRSTNPKVELFGEIYYGNTKDYQDQKFGFGINGFENASGYIVVNYGFRQVDVKYLLTKVLKRYIGDADTVGVIVGFSPYYDMDSIKYSKQIEEKHRIENKFFKYGSIGTLTLSDNGLSVDTNNLSKTNYSK